MARAGRVLQWSGAADALARAGALVALLGAAAYTLHVTGGLGHGAWWNTWFYEGVEELSAAVCLLSGRRRERRPWALIGAGLCLYSFGDVYFDHLLPAHNPPYPSWADAGYLSAYPLFYAGMTWMIRRDRSGAPAGSGLEGLLGALSLGTVAATFVFDPVVASTHGTVGAVATNLAYPTADVLLLALVAAGFVVRGRGAGWGWLLLGLALLANGVGDAVYLVQQADGTYSTGGPINSVWLIADALMTLGAVIPRPAPRAGGSASAPRSTLVLTGGFTVLIVGVLGLEIVRPIPVVAHGLLTAAVIVLLLRLVLAGRERRQLVQRTREALTDDLTGLANRRGFYAATERALRTGRPAALLLLDLNRFKELNDTLGHGIGDEALRQVAARLSQAVPPGATLARLGGDEFVAVLDGTGDESTALSVARAVQASLEAPFSLDSLLIPVQASLGLALAPRDAGTAAELLRCADVAMYAAKSRHTGTEIYESRSDVHTRDRLQLVSDLRHALDAGELVLHYQPQIATDGHRLAGVEALVRWQHPRLGLLGPERFVPLAERDGLMRPLTLTVLDLALAQLSRWVGDGRPTRVAVNLSPSDLLDSRLPDDVAAALDRHGVPAGLLELEVTENTLMRDPARGLDTMARIGELGVAFALDDFGTGYSSLAQLRRLPVRVLKIDRSFISQMTAQTEDASIVRSTIEMARSLNLTTVAEGVETDEHLDLLTSFGCSAAQGYLFSRPVPAEELTGWLTGSALVSGR